MRERFLFHFTQHHPRENIIFLIKHSEIPNTLGEKKSAKVYLVQGEFT